MEKNRTNIVTVRLNDDEYVQLTMSATGLNVSFSDYLRQCAFNGTIKSKADTENTGLLISALNKIGNNINQIAFVLNFAKKNNILEDEMYESMLDELIVIRATLGAINVC